MAKDLGLACPLCLDVNDPDDMLPVKIGHKHPPSIVEIHLCADCFRAVIDAVKEQLDSQEVASHVDDTTGATFSGDAASDVAGDSSGDLDDQPSAARVAESAAAETGSVDAPQSTISSGRES